MIVSVPSISVLTPNSDRYKSLSPYPTIAPVVIELILLTIFLTAIFLDNGPASTVSDPCLVSSFKVVRVLFKTSTNSLKEAKAVVLSS